MAKDYTVDEEQKDMYESGGFWKSWGLGYIVLVALMFLYWRNELYTANKFWVGFLFMSLTVQMARQMWAGWKNISPKMVVPPISTTTYGEPVAVAGEWAIFTKGDIFVEGGLGSYIWEDGFHIRGREGTIILPIAAINRIQRHIVALAIAHPSPLDALPEEVIEKIIYYKLKPPYYWAIADSTQYDKEMETEAVAGGMSKEQAKIEMSTLNLPKELHRPSVGFIIKQYKTAQTASNMYKEQMIEFRRALEDNKAAIRRLKDIDQKGFRDLLDEMFRSEKKES